MLGRRNIHCELSKNLAIVGLGHRLRERFFRPRGNADFFIADHGSADASRFAGLRINQHYVGEVDRSVELYPLAGFFFFAGADILSHLVNTFHDYALLNRKDLKHFPLLTFILAG